MDERRLIIAFLATQFFTGCSIFNKPVPATPPYQPPSYDARLTVPCPPMYSTLPTNASFDDVMDAHNADVAQAEVCRCRYNALIKSVAPKVEVYTCPATAQVPQPASGAVPQ